MKGDMDFPQAVKYAALVGLVVGLIGSLPLLRLPNICCLWIILGGFATAYLSGRYARSVEYADCAIVGGVFGVVFGIVVNVATFIVNIPLNVFGVGSLARGITGQGILSRVGIHLGLIMIGDIAVVVLNIVLGVLFGAVGGLIYAAAVDDEGEVKPVYERSKKSKLAKS